MSSNHRAAGAREAAVRPAASRALGQQSAHTDGHRVAPQPPSLSTAPGIAPDPASDPASDEYAGTSLRLQVLEIIDGLLNSTGPELEEHRARLRSHVTEHPWDPETALLQYLWDRDQHFGTPPALPGSGR
ncbi:hypothetical protein AB4089_06315 [Arthrobacter sp. 2MCAF15]|uniref:hypothetical protein n=1 Tax=Arthrobacter sp. 2MCAF15 TaxID=3232984 RepID=UPI003F90B109